MKVACLEPEQQTEAQQAQPLRLRLYTRVTILTVSSIDTPAQRFTTQLYACVSARGQLQAAGLYETFNPELEWLDCEVLEPITNGWERVERDDDVEWHYRARMSFAEQFELQRFPFDWQRLSMTLSSRLAAVSPLAPVVVELVPMDISAAYSGYRKGLVPSPCGSDQGSLIFFEDAFLLSSSWDYRGSSIQHWLSHPSLSAKGKQYSNLQFTLHFRRVHSYYMWNILLPLFLLTSLGFCAFCLDAASATGDRLSLLVTLLLTAAAYKIVVASSLPVTSYLTWLDKYVLVSLVQLVVLAVETAVVASVAVGRRADKAFAAAIGGLWGLFNAGFVAASLRAAPPVESIGRSKANHAVLQTTYVA